MTWTFEYNERLGIELPHLELEWEEYSDNQREQIVLRWEEIRGAIPEQILQLEKKIVLKQNQLEQEENFAVSCLLTYQIADLASAINDLHLWFRINQDLQPSASHY